MEEKVIDDQNYSGNQEQVNKAFPAATDQTEEPDDSQDNDRSPDKRVYTNYK